MIDLEQGLVPTMLYSDVEEEEEEDTVRLRIP